MVRRILRSVKDGLYHIHGKTYKILSGSRAQVFHQNAFKTKAGLQINDLKKNSHGKIVSKKKSEKAKKEKRLWKLGYRYEPNKFGMVYKDVKKKTRKNKRL